MPRESQNDVVRFCWRWYVLFLVLSFTVIFSLGLELFSPMLELWFRSQNFKKGSYDSPFSQIPFFRCSTFLARDSVDKVTVAAIRSVWSDQSNSPQCVWIPRLLSATPCLSSPCRCISCRAWILPMKLGCVFRWCWDCSDEQLGAVKTRSAGFDVVCNT